MWRMVFNGHLFWSGLGNIEMADEKPVVVVKVKPLWQTVLTGAASAIVGGLTVAFLLKRKPRGK